MKLSTLTLLTLLGISSPVLSQADTLLLSGIYSGKNLLIQNTVCENRFSIIKKLVNGEGVPPQIGDSNFELDLTIYDLDKGDSVYITLIHRPGCIPKVINGHVLRPKNTKEIVSLIQYEDYELALELSKELNQPVLLHFTGHACVNARRMEYSISADKDIQSYISENLIYVKLMVDDKSPLEEDEIYFSKKLNREVKTVGQKNNELQQEQFNAVTQPLYVLVDSEGNEIARIGYTTDVEEFRSFLMNASK